MAITPEQRAVDLATDSGRDEGLLAVRPKTNTPGTMGVRSMRICSISISVGTLQSILLDYHNSYYQVTLRDR
jgi:hypothetical protein